MSTKTYSRARPGSPKRPLRLLCGGWPCFHGSNTRLRIGEVLVARKSKRTVGPVEQEFERFRPPNKPSRLHAWFMASDPNHISSLGAVQRRYYYLLEPVGPVHQGDLSWLQMASFELVEPHLGTGLRPRTLSDSAYEKAIRRAATHYWAGKPYDRESVIWEYHTGKARVVRLVGDAA